ncbi:MAG: hypothetical protein WCF67_18265 [Chitinophagaceae bacterium]
MEKTFEVFRRERIYFISTFLMILFALCIVCFFIIDLVMLPARNASLEMSSIYFLFLPDFIKIGFTVSFTGMFIFGFLYFIIRRRKRDVLFFSDEYIGLKKAGIRIKKGRIKKAFCIDQVSSSGKLKEKFRVQFTYQNRRKFSVQLTNYHEAEALVDVLAAYPHIKVDFYDTAVILEDES